MTLRLLMIPFSLALLLCTGPAAAIEPGRVTIDLDAEATVAGRTYALADVARVAGEAHDAATLAGLEIGRAPLPGYWSDVTRAQIAARLERSGVHATIEWRGAETVRVATLGRAFSGGTVAAFAEAALRADLQGYSRFEIELVEPPRDLVLPAGTVELRAVEADPPWPAKRTAVWVDVLVDGARHRSLPVWFRVSAWTEVLTVAEAIERHHVIGADDLRRATLDVAALGAAPLRDAADAIGLRLRRALAAGAALASADLEPAPAVQQGAAVEVLAQSGRVSLRVKAVALADADVDQRVAVRSPSSGARYVVTVVGPGAARVQ
jgi:flagella basal body P-ring formation protein FlgA